MATRQVTVGYSDGTHKTMPVRPDQSILEAAEEHGVAIVNECQSGICGTCVATCTSGRLRDGTHRGSVRCGASGAKDPDLSDLRRI